jgi:hypothetical protein
MHPCSFDGSNVHIACEIEASPRGPRGSMRMRHPLNKCDRPLLPGVRIHIRYKFADCHRSLRAIVRDPLIGGLDHVTTNRACEVKVRRGVSIPCIHAALMEAMAAAWGVVRGFGAEFVEAACAVHWFCENIFNTPPPPISKPCTLRNRQGRRCASRSRVVSTPPNRRERPLPSSRSMQFYRARKEFRWVASLPCTARAAA